MILFFIKTDYLVGALKGSSQVSNWCEFPNSYLHTQTMLNNLFDLYIQVHTGKARSACTEEEVSALRPGFWDWVGAF
ncbi:MAG: hypothetical protein HC912_03715 [Saprospiraceae bacterium]|nr:hypothetical protein [Saprospiraceae bacterium]